MSPLPRIIRRAALNLLRVDIENTCDALRGEAEVMWRHGDLPHAEQWLLAAEDLCRMSRRPATLGKIIGMRALVAYHRGDVVLAINLHREEEELLREADDSRGLAVSLLNQAIILKDMGNYPYSLALLKEQEAVSRALGDNALLYSCLGNQALIKLGLGEPEEALKLFDEVDRICRALADEDGLAKTLLNRARAAREAGDLIQAEALCAEGEAAFRSLGSPVGIVDARLEMARIVRGTDRPRAARIAQEAEQLAQRHQLAPRANLARQLRTELTNTDDSKVAERVEAPPLDEARAKELYTEWCESALHWFGPRPAFKEELIDSPLAKKRLDEVVSEVTKVDDKLYVCPSPWHAALLLLSLQDRSMSPHVGGAGHSIVFRGQGDYRWPLIASIDRAGVDRDSERSSLHLFTRVMKRFLDLERAAYANLVPFSSEDEVPFEAAAQHYGIRTRLLDFTTDPTAAVAFANTGPPDSIASVFVLSYHEGVRHGLRVVLPHGYFTRLFMQRGLFVDTSRWHGSGLLRKFCTEVRFPKSADYACYRNRAPVGLVPPEPFFEKIVLDIRAMVREGVTDLDEEGCDKILRDAGTFPSHPDTRPKGGVILDSFRELWNMVYTLGTVFGPDKGERVDAVALLELTHRNRAVIRSLLHVYQMAARVNKLAGTHSALFEALDSFANKGPRQRLARLLGFTGGHGRGTPGSGQKRQRKYDQGHKWQVVVGVPDSHIDEVVDEFQRNGAKVELNRADDGSWIVFATR